ncbi:MAG TPA: HNH endonuclease [Ignavibacteria bacterium]
MKYIINEHHFNTSENVLLKDLRKTARKLGRRSVTSAEYNSLGNFGRSTILRRFGSWNKALKEAGLEVNVQTLITREDLLRNLKCVWDKLKRQPFQNEMVRPQSAYSYSSYRAVFGSWRLALKAFVKHEEGKVCIAPKKRNRQKYPETVIKQAGKCMRFDILKRDSYRCVKCGASPATDPKVILHIDHIRPRSKGGQTKLYNLQTLCSECNFGKGSKIN